MSRRQWDRMKPETYYAEVLRKTMGLIAKAEQRNNFAPVAALLSRAQEARKMLDEARATSAKEDQGEGDPYAAASDGEVETIIIEAIENLPEVVLTRIQAAIDTRFEVPTLTDVDGRES